MLLESDHPLKLGWEVQHQRPFRTSWAPNSSCVNSDKYPNAHVKPSRKKLSQIPCIKWETPPNFDLNDNWCVVAGEESKETETQKHRETRVPEAVYLRISSIPPSPSFSIDVEDCHADVISIPLIPLKPIEEETSPNRLSDKEAPLRTSVKPQTLDLSVKPIMDPPASSEPLATVKPDVGTKPTSLERTPANEKYDVGTKQGSEGDAPAAARAAFTAIMKSKELGNLIDTDLLIQFLSNPEMIVKSMNEQGLSVNGARQPASITAKVTPSAPVPVPGPIIDMNKRKSMDEPTAPPHTGLVPISLPTSKTNMEIRKPYNELGAPANTGFTPLLSSGPKIVTKQLTNEHSISASIGVATDSWTPSIPFSSSVSDGKVVRDLIDELGRIAQTHGCVGQHLPSSKPDVSMLKRLINEYGSYSGTVSLAGELTRPDMLQMRPLSPDLPSKAPFSLPTGPPMKDLDYYKSLIVKYGDGQNNVNHEGKFQNYLQGSAQVNNMNPIESQYQKPCFYFNSSKGCRNGYACPYQHVVVNWSSPSPSQGASEAPNAKRMKHLGLGGEFARRT